MTVWVSFADEVAFRTFHDAACADLGIPYPGTNVATGDLDPYSQWTTAYVDPWIWIGDLVANVRDEDVSTYRLDVAKDPPVFSGGPEEPANANIPVVPDWDWHQPIPPEYLPEEPPA